MATMASEITWAPLGSYSGSATSSRSSERILVSRYPRIRVHPREKPGSFVKKKGRGNGKEKVSSRWLLQLLSVRQKEIEPFYPPANLYGSRGSISGPWYGNTVSVVR